MSEWIIGIPVDAALTLLAVSRGQTDRSSVRHLLFTDRVLLEGTTSRWNEAGL